MNSSVINEWIKIRRSRVIWLFIFVPVVTCFLLTLALGYYLQKGGSSRTGLGIDLVTYQPILMANHRFHCSCLHCLHRQHGTVFEYVEVSFCHAFGEMENLCCQILLGIRHHLGYGSFVCFWHIHHG